MLDSATDLARAFSTTELEAALDRVAKGERVVLRRGGKRFAVVPSDDLDRLEELAREEDADLLATSLRAEAEARARGEEPVPWEEVDARLAKLP